MTTGTNVEVTRTDYKTWGDCVRIANAVAELYVTLDFGPRIIHYGLLGRPNIMFTNEAGVNRKAGPDFDEVFYPGATFDVFGGNRLWVAPQSMPETFYPDRERVAYDEVPGGARFRALPQRHNLVQLSVEVRLDAATRRVELTYIVTNVGDATRLLAPWSVTVVAPGGLEIIPQSDTPTGVHPNRAIVLWPYTDMSDPSLFWRKRFICVRQTPELGGELKVGVVKPAGWAAYVNEGTCFVTRFDPHDHHDADLGASYETYANRWYLEMESIAPLRIVASGESAQHRETWDAFPVAGTPDPTSDDELAALARAVHPERVEGPRPSPA